MIKQGWTPSIQQFPRLNSVERGRARSPGPGLVRSAGGCCLPLPWPVLGLGLVTLAGGCWLWLLWLMVVPRELRCGLGRVWDLHVHVKARSRSF